VRKRPPKLPKLPKRPHKGRISSDGAMSRRDSYCETWSNTHRYLRQDQDQEV
jgi:hypothetical protein